jgi:hypothetical protein
MSRLLDVRDDSPCRPFSLSPFLPLNAKKYAYLSMVASFQIIATSNPLANTLDVSGCIGGFICHVLPHSGTDFRAPVVMDHVQTASSGRECGQATVCVATCFGALSAKQA